MVLYIFAYIYLNIYKALHFSRRIIDIWICAAPQATLALYRTAHRGEQRRARLYEFTVTITRLYLNTFQGNKDEINMPPHSLLRDQ